MLPKIAKNVTILILLRFIIWGVYCISKDLKLA